jgi:hypothetical protein
MAIDRQKAGGVAAGLCGIYGIVAVIFTGLESGADRLVMRIGWGGAFFSFVLIVLSIIAFSTRSRWIGALIAVTAVGGLAWVGWWLMVGASHGAVPDGMAVGICMLVSLLAGIFAMA